MEQSLWSCVYCDMLLSRICVQGRSVYGSWLPVDYKHSFLLYFLRFSPFFVFIKRACCQVNGV